jgi:hypothetical protein
VVFAFLKCALWTNTNADLPRARRAFGEVNNYGSVMLVHANQQLNKRQGYICCAQDIWA